MSEQPAYLERLTTTMPAADYAVTGVAERWAAPVAIINATEGFGEEVWGLHHPNSLLAWRMAGAEVISEVAGFRGAITARRERKVNLQPLGASNHYRAQARVRFGHFYISDGLLTRVGEGMGVSGFTSASLRPDLIMFEDEQLHKQLDIYADRSSDAHHPPSRVEMEACALMIVDHLVGVHHLGRSKRASRGGLAPWQVKRTCEAMMAQLDSDLGLDDLAAIAGCSPTHFSRAFKQSMGIAPFLWLAEQRIEKAKALLEENRLPLAEIALACGFGGQSQFTTAFGKAAGMPPGAWRRHRMF